MTNSVSKTLRYGKGYRGALGNRCWVSEITGTDEHYGWRRDFLDPESVEREHFNRSRSMIYFTFSLELDCIYELSQEGERWFAAVVPCGGQPHIKAISEERVKAWAKALDEGLTSREARLASNGL